MKFSRRVIGPILFVSLVLLAGILFWPFVLEKIIEPISLATWLLLRIFVLSIDQKYYWGAIIFVVLVFLIRLLPQEQVDTKSEDLLESNATIKNIGYWRSLFALTSGYVEDEDTIKRELIRLLLSLHASKQRTSTNFMLYDALERGEIPLPEHIHAFLFLGKQKKSERLLNRLIQSIRAAPRKWIRRWTGQETAEYYRMIDETLCFMERSMEMKNDNGKFTRN